MGSSGADPRKNERKFPNLEEISPQSDCPSTQYRNEKCFFLFLSLCKKLKLKRALRHFSAPGHGKRRVNSVEGNSKEMLDRDVCCGTDILCSDDIIDFMKTKATVIDFFKINLEEIGKIDKILPTKDLTVIQQTM